MEIDALVNSLQKDVNGFFDTFKKAWDIRLKRSVVLSAGSLAAGTSITERIATAYAAESEKRVSDIQSLILQLLENLHPQTTGATFTEAAAMVLKLFACKIHEEIVQYGKDDIRRRGYTVDLTRLNEDITAQNEVVQIWTGFDIRKKAWAIWHERELLQATLNSARANSLAAEAERESANATKVAADAAKRSADLTAASVEAAVKTSTWTKWAAIFTAGAAAATAVSAYSTMRSASVQQQSASPQTIQQQIPDQSADKSGHPTLGIACDQTKWSDPISRSILMHSSSPYCWTGNVSENSLSCRANLELSTSP